MPDNESSRDVKSKIDGLLRERQPGFTLPAFLYTSPEVFAHEIDQVFLKSWLLSGHISQIPEIGGFYTLEVGGHEVIVARKSGEAIVAYFNVCRHRGCPLTDEKAGRVASWVCPYHAWVYNLDGSVRSARGMAAEQLDSLRLRECKVHILAGFIFVNANTEAGDMDNIAADFAPLFAKHELQTCTHYHRESWQVAANWKLLIENFDECYHCESIHPEYTKIVAHAGPEASASPHKLDDLRREFAHWETNALSLGSPVGLVETPPTADHWCARYPLKRGVQTLSVDGKLVAPLLGSFVESDGGVTSSRVFPGSYVIASCDYVIAFQFLPISQDLTEVRATWLIEGDAAVDGNVDVRRLTEFWRLTVEQDNKIVARQQIGIRSHGYSPGPFAPTEDYCEHYIQWYSLKMLKEVTSRSDCAGSAT